MRRMPIALFLCSLLAALLPLGFVCAAEKGAIIFCQSFSSNWEPQEIAASFDGHVISWIAQSGEPYGVSQLVLSIYQKKGSEESLIERRSIPVRPTWNTMGLRNMAFPGTGDFLLSLEKQDGTVLCEGSVTVVSVSQKDAAKTETLGTTLSDVFNKYLPQTK